MDEIKTGKQVLERVREALRDRPKLLAYFEALVAENERLRMGSPRIGRSYATDAERFWAKVQREGDAQCWLFLGSRTRGYGKFYNGGKYTYAHRYAYELLVGPIPDELQLDHLCRVRHCVNPAHLEAVTHQVNGLRGTSPLADNARKTECVRGHPFDDENTYRDPKGRRQCRACSREKDRRRYATEPAYRARKDAHRGRTRSS